MTKKQRIKKELDSLNSLAVELIHGKDRWRCFKKAIDQFLKDWYMEVKEICTDNVYVEFSIRETDSEMWEDFELYHIELIGIDTDEVVHCFSNDEVVEIEYSVWLKIRQDNKEKALYD